MNFKELDLKKFDLFEQANPDGSFYQSVYQKKHFDEGFRKSVILGVEDDSGQVLLGALISSVASRTGLVYEIMGGPLVKDDLDDQKKDQVLGFFLDNLKPYLKKHHAYYLRVIPNIKTKRIDNDSKETDFDQEDYLNIYRKRGFIYHDLDDQIGMSTKTPHYEYKKDLAGLDEKKLFKSYSKKTQYSIKKTHDFGIQVRKISYDELEEFHNNTTRTAKRIGFSDKTLAYYQSSYRAFGDKVLFLVAEIDLKKYIDSFQGQIDKLNKKIEHDKQIDAKRDKPTKTNQIKEFQSQISQHEKRIEQGKEILKAGHEIINLAGAMFFIQPQEVSYMFSYTNVEFKNFYGPYRIQEEMLNLAVKNNIPYYNFYGVSGDTSGNDGVYEFKKGFNGYLVSNMGPLILPVKKFRYSFLQSLKKLLRR